MSKKRLQDNKLKRHFNSFDQALILLGARQVGKTTILKKLFPDALYLLLDEENVKKTLESYSSDVYKSLIGNSKTIIIDEAHLLSNPGRAVKLIYDQLKNVKIIVTDSSSLHIQNQTAESMAGRAIDYHLYPLTIGEFLEQSQIENTNKIFIHRKIINQDIRNTVKTYDYKKILENTMIFGQYPQILNLTNKIVYLKNLAEKAIFKDIIELDLIDKRSKALQLLRLLAYQMGNLISYSELAEKLALSTPTIQRYIDIFEQSFILYRLYPYSKNKRKEIGKAPKIYFWDLGLRNALIDNFDPINIRSDAGAMFENFIITEVKKEIEYLNLDYKINYWRVKSGYEVDLVMSNNQILIGCEIKLNNGQISKAFTNKYPNALTYTITSNNFL